MCDQRDPVERYRPELPQATQRADQQQKDFCLLFKRPFDSISDFIDDSRRFGYVIFQPVILKTSAKIVSKQSDTKSIQTENRFYFSTPHSRDMLFKPYFDGSIYPPFSYYHPCIAFDNFRDWSSHPHAKELCGQPPFH